MYTVTVTLKDNHGIFPLPAATLEYAEQLRDHYYKSTQVLSVTITKDEEPQADK